MNQTRRNLLLATGVAFATAVSGCLSTDEQENTDEDTDTTDTMADFTPEWHTIETPDGVYGAKSDGKTKGDYDQNTNIQFALLPELGVAIFMTQDWVSSGVGTGLSVVPISELNKKAV